MKTNQLASPNFSFLADIDTALLLPAAQAERYLLEDPASALGKLRLFAERAAKKVAAQLGIYAEEREDFAETLRNLAWRRAFDDRIADLFHTIRKDGNRAVHSGAGSAEEALRDLRFAHKIAEWLYRSVKDPGFRAPAFIPPPPAAANAESQARLAEVLRLNRELEAEAARARGETEAERAAHHQAAEEKERLWAELAELKARIAESEETRRREAESYETELVRQCAAAPVADSPEARAGAERALNAALSMEFDEAATRALIDAQLRAAGWETDTARLRFSRGARPEKGRNKAIAEWPCGSGRVDYALFHGLEAMGVIEAKRASRNIPGVLGEAEDYAQSFSQEGVLPAGGPWGKRLVPFAYATNGRDFLQQLPEASGIWFRDLRSPSNHARPLVGWHSPEGLAALLKQDRAAAERALDEFGFELDFPLRGYQKEAILAAEAAIREGKRKVLLAMATGTGKTKTCIALLYRLLSSRLFRRALFLVDRRALGMQAADAFKETQIKGLRSFADDFGIKEIGEGRPDIDTKVSISTVQSMVKRILSADAAEQPPVDEFDLVIVDECHRGYLLDRELSDDELEFRSYEDYISKYRRVLEHFDAVRIGMTATPAPQTTEIFGEPVHYYSYRQAVIDGFLIDHRPPISIRTKLSESGISWAAGEQVPVYRPEKGQIELFRIQDELAFDVSEFNKRVVTREFNRVVCEYLAGQIDPTGDAKTLIFCATDMHADIVVEELLKAFEARYGEIDDSAVKKITGAASDPLALIRRYKNERTPSVAVTVDLLTTGIDVHQICNLVFIRRVNSRILYDQMMGRATRLCDEIGKEYFEIYDAVGICETMGKFTDMKPVVVNPKIGFEQLIGELAGADRLPPAAAETARRTALEQFRAKLQRKLARLKDEGKDAFRTKTGLSPSEFSQKLADSTPAEAAAFLGRINGLGSWLDKEGTGNRLPLPISEHKDALTSAQRRFPGAATAQDYLEHFKAYLESHRNDIAALRAVTTRPSSLTRTELKKLLMNLDEAGFAESALREAYRDATNADVAASIIGFIRQRALGDPLIPWETRVDLALTKLKASRPFSRIQLDWLERIARQMKAEVVVDRAAFDRGIFQAAGGFDRINKFFEGKLEQTIEELADSAWQNQA